jgi:VanZ family protein
MSKSPVKLPGFFNIPRFDLILHFIEYGMLAYLVISYFEVSPKCLSFFNRALITVIFCGVIGGLNELWQIHVPNRTLSLADEVVNILGALVVVLVFRFNRVHKFRENK